MRDSPLPVMTSCDCHDVYVIKGKKQQQPLRDELHAQDSCNAIIDFYEIRTFEPLEV